MSKTTCLEKFNYDPLPIDLKEKLIEFALEVHQKKIGIRVIGSTYGSDVDHSVIAYMVHPKLTNRVQAHYSKFIDNHPTLSTSPGRGVTIQIINGPLNGEEFATIYPHIDPDIRPRSLMYILSPGGDDVKTTWYEQKDKKYDHKTEDGQESKIMYEVREYQSDELVKLEEHTMQEDNWYVFNHSIVHGVTNIKSLRIILTCALDYEKIASKQAISLTEEQINKIFSEWSTLDCMK